MSATAKKRRPAGLEAGAYHTGARFLFGANPMQKPVTLIDRAVLALLAIILAAMLFAAPGCKSLDVGMIRDNPDGTQTVVPVEQVVNDAVQAVSPFVPQPWGLLLSTIGTAVAGFIGADRVRRSKEASYNAGMKKAVELGQTDEPSATEAK